MHQTITPTKDNAIIKESAQKYVFVQLCTVFTHSQEECCPDWCHICTPRCLLWVFRLVWVCFITYLSHFKPFYQVYGIVVLHGSSRVYREP